MEIVKLPRQPNVGEHLRADVALKARVMHGEHGRCATVKRTARVIDAQINRRQRHVPVVRMQHHRASDNAR